jgi:hypothetical protein
VESWKHEDEAWEESDQGRSRGSRRVAGRLVYGRSQFSQYFHASTLTSALSRQTASFEGRLHVCLVRKSISVWQ